jgi:hypothetical protein
MPKTLLHLLGVSTFLLAFSSSSSAQSIIGFPVLEQTGSTTFDLSFRTDSAAIITVHVAQDSLFSNAFIFLGRSTGADNQVKISMTRLRENSEYRYRIFLGQVLTPHQGTFSTATESKNQP